MAEADGIDGLDTSVAHPARVYDYWLGGKDNFAADREAAERVLAAARRHPADLAHPGAGGQVLRRPRARRPGLVQVHQWRPGPGDFAPEGTVSAHGGVARKP